MQLTFLKAAVSLAKTIVFSPESTSYTTSAYPMVRRVTSHVVNVDDMLAFGNAIEEEGAKGNALLFGSLKRPLEDESRAGFADKDRLHEWVCFDFDKVDKPPTIEGALDAIRDYLPDCCQGVEHVIQLSASCHNPSSRYLSCHVFMRLNTPVDTRTLKDFLLWCNFNNDALRSQLQLTDSGSALKYKLDPSVADPSRLIYISPPRCIGYTPPQTELLAVYDGERGITLPTGCAVERQIIHDTVNRLREENGFEPREFKMVKMRGELVLQNAEACVISDIRASGNHYLRFNLNGGDSYAYYIDLQKPEIIGNFKGEPFLSTKEVNEAFYKQLIKATQNLPAPVAQAESLEVLGFYATNRDSALYIGTYDRATDKMRVDRTTETAASAWFKQFGLPLPSFFPHHDLVYDISSDVRYEAGHSVINLYQRTNFIKQFGNTDRKMELDTTMALLDERCPITSMFVRSITGDPKSAEGFINWLAFIFQNRIKTGTAWLLWGVPGSGKGKFLEHVCKPLFGQENVGQVLLANVDKQFNSLLDGKILVNIDEAAMSRTRDKVEAMSKLSNWITEPFMVINKKNISEHEVPSFTNFIVSSNDYRPIMLTTDDRRYHVGTRQAQRLLPTPNEFATLVQGSELPFFAQLLGELIVNEKMMREPEMNQQKARLYEATHSITDSVAMAILEGDASFFFEARPSNLALQTGHGTALQPIAQYDDLLRAMLNKSLSVLRHEDLYVLFQVVVSDPKFFPENTVMQKQLFNRYGLAATEHDLHVDQRTGQKVHGVKAAPWKDVPSYMHELVRPKHDESTVVPMRSKQ